MIFSIDKLKNILKNHPAYRLKQAISAVFSDCIDSWDNATVLPKDLREILKKECPLEIKAEIKRSKNDQTAKAVVFLDDGLAVETVLMRHKNSRNTVCVSSQVGCSLGCDFCATAAMGFKRNLTKDEIIVQVLIFSRVLKKRKQKVTNIVFMGMGEPFLNYNQVMNSIRVLNDKEKFNIGARRISISTVGIVEGIKKLSDEKLQINLAVSVNATDNILRGQIMPVNNKYPIEEILKTTGTYIQKTGRRVMVEYLMLKDINDSEKQAETLVDLLKKYLGKLFFVNLIAYNPTEKYQPSTVEAINKFKKVLEKADIEVVQRYRFGKDIKGACGQLVTDHDNG